MRLNIFKIQKFSIHDGPGIRTTVFFRGCPLRCQWCHNPEALKPGGKPDEWVLNQLITELEKDRIFYDESGGGVTLSGGEPLLQDISQLAQMLKERGISVVIDTCGDVPHDHVRKIIPYTDLFLYDIKMLETYLHRDLTGSSNERILDNLVSLSRENVDFWLRLPLLSGINDGIEHMEKIASWLNENSVRPSFVSLLPYHQHGRSKYSDLGFDTPQDFKTPDQNQLDAIKYFWEGIGYATN